MKSSILSFLLIFTLSATAQSLKPDSIPVEVSDGFNKEYPDAKLKGWQKKGDQYIADVRIDGQSALAAFSSAGHWIETVFEISEKEMPGRISNYLDANYPAYEVKQARYKENKANGAFYFLELKKPRSGMDVDMEIYFDVTGNFMKKNDFHPITEAISTGTVQEAERKAREEKERKEYEERRAALLSMDRSIDENNMPSPVLNNFRKKFSKAEETKWDSLDNTYTARFYLGDLPLSANFALNGDWLSTTEDLTGGEIFRPVDQYLYDNYAGYRVKTAHKVTSRDRNNYFYVEVHEKTKKGIVPPVTKLYFDKSGRLSKAEEPSGEPETVVEDTDTGQREEDEPDRFEATLEKEAGKEKPNKERSTAAQTIPAKELPSPIQLYLSKDYPEYKVSRAYYDEYDEVGMAYKVTIRREGVNQQGYDFYFSEQGSLLLAENPPPRKEETIEKPQSKEAEPVIVAEEEEEPVSEDDEISGEDEVVYTGTQVSESDVPDAVKKSFSRRYPRAEEIVWMEEENKFLVEFYHNDVKNILEFTPDGVIQVTRTEVDPGSLFGPIRRILDDKFAGYKVRYSEKIVRKDRNNFFYVELYTKKKKISPQELELYFDKVGRLMENPPE